MTILPIFRKLDFLGVHSPPLHLIELIFEPFGSTKISRLWRSSGSTTGLLGSKAVQSIIRFEASIGPKTWLVDGSTGRTDRCGLVFKTLKKTIVDLRRKGHIIPAKPWLTLWSTVKVPSSRMLGYGQNI